MSGLLRSAQAGFGPMNRALLADDDTLPTPVTQPVKRRERWSRKRLLITGTAIIAMSFLGWAGYDWFTTGRYIVSTDDAYVGGNVTDLAPKVSGLITDVAVTDNQLVHKGDLLVTIDDRDFRAAVVKAQAAVAGDEAQLANLNATRTLQLSLIAEAQAQLQQAAAQANLAQLNRARYRSLAASNAGSVQDSQTADSNLQQAEAGVAKAQAGLAAAQAQLAVIGTQAQQADAALSGAQADLTTAQLNLGYTQIRAPIDGVIGNRSAHLGAYATAGAQLVTIVPVHGLWVDANFKEDQLAHIESGQNVDIEADVDPGVKIYGHVANLAPATGAVFSVLPAENATGNFTKIVQRVPVRIVLDGDASHLGLLRPGLSVTADINTK
ncbi:MAG: HlyD family secretion protein [Acidocella sp.]|nr:HlyD family secretion protein [Acidocella sp.]